MKRIHPLFIYDTNRNHKFGDCDWIACTQAHNAFLAKVTFVSDQEPTSAPNLRIGRPNRNGIQVRLDLMRAWGNSEEHPQTIAEHLSLMKAAEKHIIDATNYVHIDSGNPTTQQVIDYLELIVHTNLSNLRGDAPTAEKQTTLTSLKMLKAAIDKIKTISDEE